MSIATYLMFIATQPLWLRLAMVVVAGALFWAIHAMAASLLGDGAGSPRTEERKAHAQRARNVISVPYFY